MKNLQHLHGLFCLLYIRSFTHAYSFPTAHPTPKPNPWATYVSMFTPTLVPTNNPCANVLHYVRKAMVMDINPLRVDLCIPKYSPSSILPPSPLPTAAPTILPKAGAIWQMAKPTHKSTNVPSPWPTASPKALPILQPSAIIDHQFPYNQYMNDHSFLKWIAFGCNVFIAITGVLLVKCTIVVLTLWAEKEGEDNEIDEVTRARAPVFQWTEVRWYHSW